MELKDEVIFILGIAKFDGPFESTSFTAAKYLARQNDVYYIDYPFTFRDTLERDNPLLERRKPYFRRGSDGVMKTHIDRLNILIVPPVMSLNFLPEGWLYRFLLKISQRSIVRRIRKTIRKKGFERFIFINSFNFHYPDVGRWLSPKLLVYHCVDPLIVEYDTRHGIKSEQILVNCSDLVICTSKQLYREKYPQNPNTFFIPNAADLDHSSKALNPDLPVYPNLLSIRRPVAGYFGNIERRIDFQLLSSIIKKNPLVSFVFAGPINEEYVPTGFREFENVYFTGRIPYEDMPAVIKGFDVAMIPFKKDGVSHTIFPLKLFEYLGAGKPVVATNFNLDLEEFTGGTVPFCSNAEEFSQALDHAINHDTKEKKNARLDIAAANTWEKRLSEFSSLIHDFSLKKHDGGTGYLSKK